MRHMTNCMDVSLTYWRKRHKKRNRKLKSSFLAEVLQVARQITFGQQKRGRVYPRISCDTTLIPLLYDTIYNKAIQQKNCGVLSGFI